MMWVSFVVVVFVLYLFLYKTGQRQVLAVEVIISFLRSVITSIPVLILETVKRCLNYAIHSSTILLDCIHCVDFILFPLIDAVVWFALIVHVLIIVIFGILGPAVYGIHIIYQGQMFENKLLSVILIVVLWVGVDMCKTSLADILHPALYVILTDVVSGVYIAIRIVILKVMLTFVRVVRVMYRHTFRKLYTSNRADSSSQSSECVICFEEGRDFVILFPCEHEAICESCIGQIIQLDRRCPLCRSYIIHVYENNR